MNYSVGHLFRGVELILRLFGRIGGSILRVGLLLRFWRLIVGLICRCLLIRRGFLGLCCLVCFVSYVFGEVARDFAYCVGRDNCLCRFFVVSLVFG